MFFKALANAIVTLLISVRIPGIDAAPRERTRLNVSYDPTRELALLLHPSVLPQVVSPPLPTRS